MRVQSSSALNTYASGTNHVLPTACYTKSYSALDVNHFMKRSQVQIVTREGLAAHANSVHVRRE